MVLFILVAWCNNLNAFILYHRKSILNTSLQHQLPSGRDDTHLTVTHVWMFAVSVLMLWSVCSVGVSQEKHDALLLEVQRLEAELGRIRGDLQGVMGCQGKCDRLDTIHETVSIII